jgi:hypothetical protein
LAKTRALKENDDGRIVCGIVWDSADRKGTSKNAGEGCRAPGGLTHHLRSERRKS